MSDIAGRFPHLSPLKQALLALREMKAKLDESERKRTEPIAVIGIGCRFPGRVDNPDSYWGLLQHGHDAVVEIPKDRWNYQEYYSSDPGAVGKMNIRYGGFLERVDLFDADFFGISPREARSVDPQQRLALEVAWEAIEDSGYAPTSMSGSRTGVFLGITADEYAQRFWRAGDLKQFDIYFASGIARSIAAGRISYFLGLNGPTLVVDTACSSSLVAVHQACQSLRLDECRTALAGGVNVVLSAETTLAFSKAGMMAADGRCKTFDAAADGFVRGEGCGIVVLKRLSDALADGDRVRAVILGSAVNQDGRSSGLTAPSGPAQQALLRNCLGNAGVKSEEVQYVEAHGTGTALGDPIEVQALGAVLGRGRERALVIGSVKTNLGHLEAAAGVAGLIKTVLALEHGEIPGQLHFKRLNPHIQLEGAAVEVAERLQKWPEGKRRIAGVSSFGFSGTNAHVILEQAGEVEQRQRERERPGHVLTISGRSAEAVRRLGEGYREHLEGHPEQELGDVCYTANAGRAQWGYRRALVAGGKEELRERLGEAREAREAGRERPRIGMLFPGQGSQYAGMGKELYESHPVFRQQLKRLMELMGGKVREELEEVLFGKEGGRLERTEYAQPALFAVEYALAEQWGSWGIEGDYVIGHSVGEYVAACRAGVFSVEQGLELVTERGRLMQGLPAGGAMAALRAAEEQVREAIKGRWGVELAAVNGAESVVVSGESEEVEELVEQFGGKRLEVSHAFHSARMEPVMEEFRRAAGKVEYREPRVGMILNLTGKVTKAGEVSRAEYWVRQLRETVQFGEGMRTAWKAGVRVMLEVGPGTTLLSEGRRGLGESKEGLWLASIRRGREEWRQMLESVGAMYEAGVEVDWEGYDRPYRRRKVSLPTYPFERQRYWIEPAARAEAAKSEAKSEKVEWEGDLSSAKEPYLAEHRVRGRAILPMAAYLEMVRKAARESGLRAEALTDVAIEQPLEVAGGAGSRVRVSIGAEGWEFWATTEGVERRYAAGRLGRAHGEMGGKGLEEYKGEAAEAVEVGGYYERLRDRGVDFGPSFRTLQELWKGPDVGVGRVSLKGLEEPERGIHPALLDGCLQVMGAALEGERLYLPTGMERYEVHAQGGLRELWSCAAIRRRDAEGALVDLSLFDSEGQPVAEIQGLHLRVAAAAADDGWLYQLRWLPKPRPTRSGPSPRSIAAELQPQVASLFASHGATQFEELHPRLDRLCLSYIAAAFRQLGWDYVPGERIAPGAVVSRLRIAERHRRLTGRLLNILAEDAVLLEVGGEYEVRLLLPANDSGELADGLLKACPAFAAELELTLRCGTHLAEALRGDCDPLTLLFPDPSATNLAALYHSSPKARVYNTLLREAIKRGMTGGAPLRVLEIGAGTGGSTPYVLEALPPDTGEYLFTDISPRFTVRAAEFFRGCPFFQTRVLDIEGDPEAQGLRRGAFDLVIAANVLHATADLRSTLANVRKLLSPGGLLALVETTAPERWIDLSFGLLEGWWRFQDTDLRPDYTLLSGARWESLLGKSGFEEAVAVGTRGENLILARGPEQVPQERWLIVAGAEETGSHLAADLRAKGADCTLVPAGEPFRSAGFGTVVDLRALDSQTPDSACSEPGLAGTRTAHRIVEVVQAIADGGGKPPRMWLVTRGAQAVEGSRGISVWQTPVWGIGRTIALEQPELRCGCIDLDPEGGYEGLLEELIRPDEETQIGFRGGVRYVARMGRIGEEARETGAVQLTITTPGRLDGLEYRPVPRRAPGPGEVEIRVAFAALNFKDVLRALGRFPEIKDALGSECAGRIEAVGAGVSEYRVGERVVATVAGALGSYVTVGAMMVARQPEGVSGAEAVTVPIAFLTARYALEQVGRMKAGDRVLIHAAAGGVGQAAVQLAKRAGAEIYATAGSEGKREWLRSQGIEHVYDSRSGEFGAEIRKATGGRGVDLVLNSLAGEMIEAGLGVVAEGGRFVEIGKAGVWERERVRALRGDIEYEVVDWGDVWEREPERVGRMLREIMGEVERGELEGLAYEVYEQREVEQAFRRMAQGRHRGKVVIRQERAGVEIGGQGAYLITGGLGGLGLKVAEWLVGEGAEQVVLVGRHEAGEEARAAVGRMERAGGKVWVRRADVSRREEIEGVVRELEEAGQRLRGVIHAAGVLDDGVLGQQNEERMERVLGPKVAGAWHLHELTKGKEVELFVMFSSLASVLGSAGQANHAAGNAFLDGMAHLRRGQGEAGVSIQWGAWSEVGSARGAELRQRRESKGIGEMSPGQGLGLMGEILRRNLVEAAAGPVDWEVFAREAAGGRAPWLSEMATGREEGQKAGGSRREQGEFLRRLAEAPAGQRQDLLQGQIRAEAARILGLDSQRIDVRRPLSELGLDSLMAVELRNALAAVLDALIPVTLLYDYPSIEDVARHLHKLLFPQEAPAGEGGDLLGSIENLADEDVDRLLAQRTGKPR